MAAYDDWTEDETISAPAYIRIEYADPTTGDPRSVVLTSTQRTTTRTYYIKVVYRDISGQVQVDDVVFVRESETYATVASVNGSYIKWRLENKKGLPDGSAYKYSRTEYRYIITAEGAKVIREETQEQITEYELAGSLAIEDYTGWEPTEQFLISSNTVVEYDEKGGINSKPYTKTVTSRYLAWGLTQEGQQVAAEMLKLDEGDGVINKSVVDAMKELISDGSETRSSLGKTPTPGRPTPQQMAAEEIQKSKDDDSFGDETLNLSGNTYTSGEQKDSFESFVDIGFDQFERFDSSSIDRYSSFGDLNATSGTTVGDRSVVSSTGDLYEWDGSQWNSLGSYGDWLNNQAAATGELSTGEKTDGFDSVGNIDDLLAIENANTGDQRYLEETSDVYRYDGQAWENLGPVNPLINDTVAGFGDLGLIDDPKLGDKYLTLDENKIVQWNGSQWEDVINLDDWMDGQSSDYRSVEFNMPYAPDSYYGYANQSAVIVDGNSDVEAAKYGEIQNALVGGHANGLNVTCAIDALPSFPFSLVYVDAGDISVAYRTDGTSYAFDSSGLVVSSDLLLCGIAGRLVSIQPQVLVGGSAVINTTTPNALITTAFDAVLVGEFASIESVMQTAEIVGPTKLFGTGASIISSGFTATIEFSNAPYVLSTTAATMTLTGQSAVTFAESGYFGVAEYTGTWNGSTSTTEISTLTFKPGMVLLFQVGGSGVQAAEEGDDGIGGGRIFSPILNYGSTRTYHINTKQGQPQIDGGSERLTYTPEGFTLNTVTSNLNSKPYIAFAWRMGHQLARNTQGSVESFTMANSRIGMSAFTYLGTSNNMTVGHGLGGAPEVVWIQSRETSTGTGSTGDALYSTWGGTALKNHTDPDTSAYAAGYWSKPFNGLYVPNATSFVEPFTNTFRDYGTSTLALGPAGRVNQWNIRYWGFAFRSVAGWSKIGTYQGNGTSRAVTGVGFQPDLVMIWSVFTGQNTMIYTSQRPGKVNFMAKIWYQDLIATPIQKTYVNTPERTISYFTFTADGFSLGAGAEADFTVTVPSPANTQWQDTAVNKNGETYVYMAFNLG